MFGVILSVAVTLMQGYVFWRAASVPFVVRNISRKRLLALGIALWLLFLLGRAIPPEDTGSLATVLEFAGMTWMAVLFLLSVCLLAVELATGFGFLLRKLVPALRGAALVAGGILSVLALVQGLRAPVMQRYDVYLDGLPAQLDGTVLVAMSDLHLGTLLGPDWLAARIDQVQAEQPDAVVLLGDIFEGHGQPQAELLATLRRLSAPLGIWAVPGNHETYNRNMDDTALFEQAGAHLLNNTWAELRPGLVLAGVKDLAHDSNADNTKSFLAKALAGRPAGATILLSHAPLAPELITRKGVNLMLGAHTHAGQLWPFGYLVKRRFPLFEGRYELEDMTVIVSRGTGTWGPRMRLWQPAEILRVTLHASKTAPLESPPKAP